MAHELDTNEATGRLAFFGRHAGWHNEGVVDDRVVTVEEALRLSGTAFTVETRPIYTAQFANGDVDDVFYHMEPDYRAVVRTDRNATLGVVGKRYTPLQNADAFAIMEPLLDAGAATIETAGSLREGRDVWLLVKFNIEDERVREVFEARGDRVIPYGLISNNHSGARQVRLMETPVRVVCANTLGMANIGLRGKKAAGKAFEVKHTLNVEARTTDAARELFADVVARYVAIAEQYRLLKARHLDTALFRKLVLDVAAPIPEKLDRAKLEPREQTSRQKIEERRERLSLLWDFGTGNDGQRTSWEAYNAVTESIDHDVDLWRLGATPEAQMRSMFEGRAGDIKQEVLNNLVADAVALAA